MSWLNPICKADQEDVQATVCLGETMSDSADRDIPYFIGTKAFIQGWAETHRNPRQTVNLASWVSK